MIKRLLKRVLRGKYQGLNGLDRKLEPYVDHDGGYFVELGANDGLTQSNSYYFEKYRRWTGLLVEATPHNYLKCIQNRSPLTRIFCAACVSFGYAPEFVRMIYSNLMSTPHGLESDIADPRAHALSGSEFLSPNEPVFEFGALARPLNDLLLEAHAPKSIDFLSLDVEGAEIEVLKGVDHTAFRFKFILVECRSLAEMQAYLGAQGYRFVDSFSQHDHLFTSLAR
jgi:FkbM family methyltransferase